MKPHLVNSSPFRIVLILVALFTSASVFPALPSPEHPPSPRGPVYSNGTWQLSGITTDQVQTKRLFDDYVDLVQVRSGQRALWAAVGIRNPDNSYESWVEGLATRDDLQAAFALPRRVSLQISGTPRSVDFAGCYSKSSGRCHLTRLIEALQPGLMLDGDTTFTHGLSNIFVRTGKFPTHYRNGVLTWGIHLED